MATDPATIVRGALEEHLPMLYRTARYVLSDAHEAEDAAQEAAVEALRGAHRYDPSMPVGPWLAGIAYRSALARLRRKGAAMRKERAAADSSAPGRSEALATEALERAEVGAALSTMVAGLDFEERTAVALHFYEGLSVREVGQVQGVPHTTVQDRLTGALDRLRKGLAGAGLLAAAPAAMEAALRGLPREDVSAALASRVHGMLARKEAAHAAPKGGIAMKIVAGVVLAGSLAGAAALLGSAGALKAPPAPAGPPKHEHFASINSEGNDLDGPCKEAIGFRGGAPDAEGNLWGGRWLRASDGRVLRLSTCDYGTLGFDLKEGPIAGRPVKYVGTDYGWWCGGSAMMGRPDSGGKTDGIYESLGREGQMIRIFKNKDKGGRWWFLRAAGGGGAAAPKTKGQSADALAAKFGWINEPQVGLDNRLRFMADSCFYLLEDGKVTCVLSPEDYKPATDAMKGALPNQGYVGGDGTIYLGYYYASGDAYSGKAPAVWRVTTDGKVEPWAQSHGGGSGGDGDALKEAGWFCGPHLGNYAVARFIPPDTVLTTAHDEDFFRRIQKGRTAVLCNDGEWREFRQERRPGALDFCGGTVGPNGTVYHTYRDWVDSRLYRYTGLNFDKPTIQLRNGGKQEGGKQ